jgi:NAD(P)-dependent dehydrogenase (short-subunit alcohol dehydrogenase family)
LARRGAAVAAGFSSNFARADEFRHSIRNGGAGATIHQGNVGDPGDRERVIGKEIEQHGRLDILVNNAGLTVDRPILSMTVDDWHKVLRVNLSGALYVSKPALEHMIERGSGASSTSRRSRVRSATSARPITRPRSPGCSGLRRRSPASPRSRWPRRTSCPATASGSPSMP